MLQARTLVAAGNVAPRNRKPNIREGKKSKLLSL